MDPAALINKKIVNGDPHLKRAQKLEKRANGKGRGKPLKNYLGKVVALSSPEPAGKESGAESFAADLSKEAFLAALESTGMTGMSGNGFPLAEKITSFLSSGAAKKILLINAVECDPALLHDEWLLLHRYHEIDRAIEYLTQALSLDEVVLAAKNKAVKSNGRFSAVIVPPRYPMGEEHFLIRQALGIRLDRMDIPARHGILVLNLQSVYQIGKVASGCYDGGRFVTVADLTQGSARIAYVHPADNIASLLRECFGEASQKTLYVGQGAMASVRASGSDVFSNRQTFAAYAKAPRIDSGNKCIRCGRCTGKCPANIEVAKIVRSVDGGKPRGYVSCQPERCIRCGCCTYFCPASKNVSAYIAQAFGA